MRVNYEVKMNLAVRLRNPQFLFQIGLAIFAPICAYQGISGKEISSWPMLGTMFYEAIKNPFIVFSCAVGIYNALTDPTTPGISDSDRAMAYKKAGEQAQENQQNLNDHSVG